MLCMCVPVWLKHCFAVCLICAVGKRCRLYGQQIPSEQFIFWHTRCCAFGRIQFADTMSTGVAPVSASHDVTVDLPVIPPGNPMTLYDLQPVEPHARRQPQDMNAQRLYLHRASTLQAIEQARRAQASTPGPQPASSKPAPTPLGESRGRDAYASYDSIAKTTLVTTCWYDCNGAVTCRFHSTITQPDIIQQLVAALCRSAPMPAKRSDT